MPKYKVETMTRVRQWHCVEADTESAALLQLIAQNQPEVPGHELTKESYIVLATADEWEAHEKRQLIYSPSYISAMQNVGVSQAELEAKHGNQ